MFDFDPSCPQGEKKFKLSTDEDEFEISQEPKGSQVNNVTVVS